MVHDNAEQWGKVSRAFFILGFYTPCMWVRRLNAARAVVLAVLVVWYATHHFAPSLGVALHLHQARDETLRWEAPHAHEQHCDFCMAAGYLGIWQANLLPRAPKVLVRATNRLEWHGVQVPAEALARAPPMLGFGLHNAKISRLYKDVP